MHTLPKVPAFPREIVDPSLGDTALKVPFPYVILNGRGGGAERPDESAVAAGPEMAREVFAAYVELPSPRWSNAREALVRSLAVPQSPAPAGATLQDDAAWDGVVAAAASNTPPLAPITPPAAIGGDAQAPMKLRAKRRTPSLPPIATATPFAPAAAQESTEPVDAFLPLLKEGAAPLVPLPGPVGRIAPAVLSAAPSLTETASPAPPKRSSGIVKKVAGMILLCALLVAAGWLLVLEFMSSRDVMAEAPRSAEPATAVATPATPVPSVPEVPTAAVAQPVPEKPAGPVLASQAFADYVAGLKISGVSLGASPRALINGRMLHLGDLLDPTLQVRLVAVDGSARHLVFEDRSTARIQVRY